MLFYLSIFLGLVAIALAVKYRSLQREAKRLQGEILHLRRIGPEFVANVSHELKTPLTSIKGYTETLKTVITKDPERALDFLTRIEENSERLSHLINDILELSRIEQPNFYLEVSPFQIDALLSEICERFSFPMSAKKQILTLDNQVETLTADRWLTDQALSNLIENAHRYCGELSRISIHVSQVMEGGKPFIQFLVSDNGPGIKPEDLPRIFERFYRVDKSRNRLLGGTGLGLAIAKHIMLSHGGRIRAESEYGQGARFFLLFPKKDR
jgi:two-component system sensor histidine kinase VicK